MNTSTSNLEKGRERLELITRMNELQFEKAILPANKISQEMIQNRHLIRFEIKSRRFNFKLKTEF